MNRRFHTKSVVAYTRIHKHIFLTDIHHFIKALLLRLYVDTHFDNLKSTPNNINAIKYTYTMFKKKIYMVLFPSANYDRRVTKSSSVFKECIQTRLNMDIL